MSPPSESPPSVLAAQALPNTDTCTAIRIYNQVRVVNGYFRLFFYTIRYTNLLSLLILLQIAGYNLRIRRCISDLFLARKNCYRGLAVFGIIDISGEVRMCLEHQGNLIVRLESSILTAMKLGSLMCAKADPSPSYVAGPR